MKKLALSLLLLMPVAGVATDQKIAPIPECFPCEKIAPIPECFPCDKVATSADVAQPGTTSTETGSELG